MAIESVPATYLQGGVGAGRPRMLGILRHTYYMGPRHSNVDDKNPKTLAIRGALE